MTAGVAHERAGDAFRPPCYKRSKHVGHFQSGDLAQFKTGATTSQFLSHLAECSSLLCSSIDA
jgi:hypothetical protein